MRPVPLHPVVKALDEAAWLALCNLETASSEALARAGRQADQKPEPFSFRLFFGMDATGAPLAHCFQVGPEAAAHRASRA